MRQTLAALALFGLSTLSATGQTAVAPGREHRECESCHQPHGGQLQTTLLKGSTPDAACRGCHIGVRPVSPWGPGQAPGLSGVPETYASQHLWAEASRWERLRNRRGAARSPGACAPCHEPHAGNWIGESPVRSLKGRAYGTDGRETPGRPTTVAQVCFACHGGGTQNLDAFGGPNVGSRFSESAASSHRIGARRRADLPSMRRLGSVAPLDCTSCHGGQKESGLKGPHVSRYPSLLSQAYSTQGGVPESYGLYALCYECHDRNSILADESFPLHREHLTGQFLGAGAEMWRREAGAWRSGVSPRDPAGAPFLPRASLSLPAPCSACHDPHGSGENRALVRFDRMLVRANSLGQLAYLSAGPGRGSCSLECHGHDHLDASY